MMVTMSERGEEVERKSADPQHRISLAEAVAAAASNSASKHDFQSGSNPNSNMNMNTGSKSKCSQIKLLCRFLCFLFFRVLGYGLSAFYD
jgi:hypothetical protein